MNSREIVAIINEILETTWTNFECVEGKHVDVAPEWRAHMKDLMLRYRTAGWDVQRRVEIMSTYPRNPRDFLVFKNPQFIKSGKERFEAKYGK